MGKFHNLRHNSFKSLNESVPVTVTAIAKPPPPVKSIIGDKDRVTIYVDTGTHTATITLDESEIDCLIFELSRLKRFHDKNNHVKSVP